jgi:hypothetical protein
MFEPGRIKYCNTDLDLTSAADLTPLGEAFQAAGLLQLHVTESGNGLWYATFEAGESHEVPDSCDRNVEPELDIDVMLKVVEALAQPSRAIWDGCTVRDFNIGYDCGNEPWAFNQGLSRELIRRIAAAGATLRFTLYPNRETAW